MQLAMPHVILEKNGKYVHLGYSKDVVKTATVQQSSWLSSVNSYICAGGSDPLMGEGW